jgi:hypothetical protein
MREINARLAEAEPAVTCCRVKAVAPGQLRRPIAIATVAALFEVGELSEVREMPLKLCDLFWRRRSLVGHDQSPAVRLFELISVMPLRLCMLAESTRRTSLIRRLDSGLECRRLRMKSLRGVKAKRLARGERDG